MNDFSELSLSSQLKSNLLKNGLVTPTPVQAEAIPVALAGHDLVATAQTGTGKTLAFVLPVLQSFAAQIFGCPDVTSGENSASHFDHIDRDDYLVFGAESVRCERAAAGRYDDWDIAAGKQLLWPQPPSRQLGTCRPSLPRLKNFRNPGRKSHGRLFIPHR